MSSLRTEFVRLANRLTGQKRPLRFSWNGQPTELLLLNNPLHPRGSWVLKLRLGGHDLTLDISRLPELAWVSPELAGIDLNDLPEELACGLIESCFGEIFTALSKSGVDVAVTGVEEFAFRDAPEEIIGWTVNRGNETGWMHGYLSGNDEALAYLAGLVSQAPIMPTVEEASIPLVVHLVAGELKLPASDLGTIEVHDVLFADVAGYRNDGTCALHVSRKFLGLGQVIGKRFSLQQIIPPPVTPMAQDATAASINDLEIELTFVVGQTTLTVGELRNLTAGFTFELPIPAGQDLTILANGKSIGKGELIEVGNHLGVRVTEFIAS